MKEKTNYTLLLYEYTFGKINISKIQNQFVKAIPALLLLPFLLVFAFVALLIEEPIKCIISIIFRKSSRKEAWRYYKYCWKCFLMR